MRASADLVIVGRVATLAGDHGFGWADGIAVADGHVVAVGREAALAARAPAKPTIWRLADDTCVVPGITDAHLHLMQLILAEGQVDLTGAGMDAALAKIAVRHAEMSAARDDGWLLGHGWSLHTLGRWPDVELLEAVAPGRPVALYAHDHHARWVSRRALELAGVDAASTDLPGGLIRRDASGMPTGILHETASVLVDPVIPVPTAEVLASRLHRVAALLATLGVTGCHDPGELTSSPTIERGPVFYASVAREGRLPLRVHASVRAPQLDRAIELGLFSGQGVTPDDPANPTQSRSAARYHMGWLKLFADGSLGSRSAALLEPYADAETSPPTGGPNGMVLTDEEELADLLGRAQRAGISGQVHAIGDGAVKSVLDVFAGLLPTAAAAGAPDASGDVSKPKRRVEHAQLVDPADVPRFGALGVAASVQPVHLRSDAAPARIAWGGRAHNMFPLRALAAGGALIPMGTDAPVEPADPWPGVAVAVARRDPFQPAAELTGAHNAIGLDRSLRAACLDPALVAGEPALGRLLPGYRADLLVVPSAPFMEEFDAQAVGSVRPLATLIDGDVVYSDTRFDAGK